MLASDQMWSFWEREPQSRNQFHITYFWSTVPSVTYRYEVGLVKRDGDLHKLAFQILKGSSFFGWSLCLFQAEIYSFGVKWKPKKKCTFYFSFILDGSERVFRLANRKIYSVWFVLTLDLLSEVTRYYLLWKFPRKRSLDLNVRVFAHEHMSYLCNSLLKGKSVWTLNFSSLWPTGKLICTVIFEKKKSAVITATLMLPNIKDPNTWSD